MDVSILPRTYANEQVTTLVKKLKRDENTDIEEIIVGQHEDDRAIRAVKMGLPSKEKRNMSAHDFHCMVGHFGMDPGCVICKAAKGNHAIYQTHSRPTS